MCERALHWWSCFLFLYSFLFKRKIIFVNGEPASWLIKQILQNTYHQCVEDCYKTNNSVYAKHIRLSAVCILLSGPGLTNYTKPNSTRKNNDTIIKYVNIHAKIENRFLVQRYLALFNLNFIHHYIFQWAIHVIEIPF